MNISKALKIKNRLVRDINEANMNLFKFNSKKECNHRGDDFNLIDFAKLNELHLRLAEIKGAIAKANAQCGNNLLLAQLSETKAMITELEGIKTRILDKVICEHTSNGTEVPYKTQTTFDNEQLTNMINKLKEYADSCQDTIDRNNATVEVDVDAARLENGMVMFDVFD